MNRPAPAYLADSLPARRGWPLGFAHRGADTGRENTLAAFRAVKRSYAPDRINIVVLLTDGDRLVRTPTYHVFEMNRGHQDATSHPVQPPGASTRQASQSR